MPPTAKAAHRASHEFADAHAGGHRLETRVGLDEPKKSKYPKTPDPSYGNTRPSYNDTPGAHDISWSLRVVHGFNKGVIMSQTQTSCTMFKGKYLKNSPYIIAYNYELSVQIPKTCILFCRGPFERREFP